MSSQQDQDVYRKLIKKSVLALEQVKKQNKAIVDAQHESIAVVGMGCRFPGGKDLEAFWQLQLEGNDAITPVPGSRWDKDKFYDADPDVPGKICTKYGGFLDGIDQFDPSLFGISPREASHIDPQHRLLLEVCWETMENAYIPASSLYGTKTGVFIGICDTEYAKLQHSPTGENLNAYMGTGNAPSAASGRVSYTFGLKGPSMAIDTACSSSLVAVHQACVSLRRGESNLAFAGGVGMILSPLASMIFSKARMLAPDGRCKTFSDAANGYVRGEGCGVILLKRLSDAEKDGDNIVGLIRGSAVNQDGPSGALTVPNGPSQSDVIRLALKDARLDARDVNYVECHGTGTQLGDPIEVGAIDQVFKHGEREQPIQVGSIKTNIGHLEGAAGIAG
ncbi:MAG: polyketide synthase, partial [Pseudomonadales bacterium]|nr:polyketide synthase [Pseudomonadales bacterium]